LAAHGGDIIAQENLGMIYEMKGECSKAIEWYKKSFNGKNISAHFRCIELQLKENLIPKPKYFEILQKVADSGFPEAQNKYGVFNYLGKEIVQKSSDSALKYFYEAAKYDFPDSFYNIAVMFEFNEVKGKTIKEAFPLYLKAAEMGHAKAQFCVSRILSLPNGPVPSDSQQSLFWLEKSNNLGCAEAKFTLGNYKFACAVDLCNRSTLVVKGGDLVLKQATEIDLSLDRPVEVFDHQTGTFRSGVIKGMKEAPVSYDVALLPRNPGSTFLLGTKPCDNPIIVRELHNFGDSMFYLCQEHKVQNLLGTISRGAKMILMDRKVRSATVEGDMIAVKVLSNEKGLIGKTGWIKLAYTNLLPYFNKETRTIEMNPSIIKSQELNTVWYRNLFVGGVINCSNDMKLAWNLLQEAVELDSIPAKQFMQQFSNHNIPVSNELNISQLLFSIKYGVLSNYDAYVVLKSYLTLHPWEFNKQKMEELCDTFFHSAVRFENDSRAQFIFAENLFYSPAKITERNSFIEALKWYRLAAHSSHSQALLQLGKFYDNGILVMPDRNKALEYYLLAASLGNIEAMQLKQQHFKSLSFMRPFYLFPDLCSNFFSVCYTNGRMKADFLTYEEVKKQTLSLSDEISNYNDFLFLTCCIGPACLPTCFLLNSPCVCCLLYCYDYYYCCGNMRKYGCPSSKSDVNSQQPLRLPLVAGVSLAPSCVNYVPVSNGQGNLIVIFSIIS
jgi:TPR repeat protein